MAIPNHAPVELTLKTIKYGDLKARQKENFNFQKISGILADYGYQTIRLTDDWNGADLIVQHVTGTTILKIQLKGRFGFHQKYQGKDIWICFRDEPTGNWYIYPHDYMFRQVKFFWTKKFATAWNAGAPFHFPSLSKNHRILLEPYRIVS